jgi:MFS family permease
MGIATSGFGLGGLVIMPAAAEVLTSVGWRAFFLAAAALVVVVNGAFVLLARDAPSGRWASHEADAVEPTARTKAGRPKAARSKAARRSARKALPTAPAAAGWPTVGAGSPFRTTVFWLMAAGFALFFFAEWAFMFHGPQFLEREGLAPRQAAFVFACAAGLGIALRLVSGAVLDQVQRIEVLAGFVLSAMAAAVLLLIAGVSTPVLTAFVLLWGIGSGIGPALEPLLVGRAFGRHRYASVYGAVEGIDTVASIPGPWIGGLLFDQAGSYTPVLVLYGLTFVAGAAAFGWLARTLARRGGDARLPVAVTGTVTAR